MSASAAPARPDHGAYDCAYNSPVAWECVAVEDAERWDAALTSCGRFDTYHTAAYHRLAQDQGEGVATLIKVEVGEHHCALPLLLRPVRGVPTLRDAPDYDATSVYGYPGPLSSVAADDPRASAVAESFVAAVRACLSSLSVVSFFSRLNPLHDTGWLLEPLGEVATVSETVGIDLTLPPDAQLKQMSKGHRYDIRKAAREGITVRRDDDFAHLDAFVALYEETMRRVDAATSYFFAPSYYAQLRERFGSALALYVAEHQGEIVAASLFFVGPDTVHYHLSGARGAGLRLGGVKAILDHVRIWGSNAGFRCLHLGGGVGGAGSLMRFKAGFSRERFGFKLARAILNEPRYADLVRRRAPPPDTTFFPAYRAP